MGCGNSLDAAQDEKAQEEDGDKQIEAGKANYLQKESIKYKLLLLGAGESGKSTLLKQMRKLHGTPFDESELLAAKPHLTQNVIEAMRTLAIYSEILQDQNQSLNTKVLEINREIRDKVARMSDKVVFTEEHCNDFKVLWNDPGIRNTLEHSHQYQLIDTAEYLFSNMDNYWKEEYIPTFDDIIHNRQRTTGVTKIKFALKDKNDCLEEIYEIFDVGGQKNERRKWMHFFDNTSAILFVTALSGYNQLLWEDNRNNRMREAIGLFRGIVNLEAFKDCHVILFLNKSDLFEIKILKYSVKEYFKDFVGNEKVSKDVIDFFKNKFREQRRGSAAKKQIHFHVTCATDQNCVKKMFESVRDIVLVKDLENEGFL